MRQTIASVLAGWQRGGATHFRVVPQGKVKPIDLIPSTVLEDGLLVIDPEDAGIKVVPFATILTIEPVYTGEPAVAA